MSESVEEKRQEVAMTTQQILEVMAENFRQTNAKLVASSEDIKASGARIEMAFELGNSALAEIRAHRESTAVAIGEIKSEIEKSISDVNEDVFSLASRISALEASKEESQAVQANPDMEAALAPVMAQLRRLDNELESRVAGTRRELESKINEQAYRLEGKIKQARAKQSLASLDTGQRQVDFRLDFESEQKSGSESEGEVTKKPPESKSSPSARSPVRASAQGGDSREGPEAMEGISSRSHMVGTAKAPATPGNIRADIPSQDARRQGKLLLQVEGVEPERGKKAGGGGLSADRLILGLPLESLLDPGGLEPMQMASERNASVIVPITQVTWLLRHLDYKSVMHLLMEVYRSYRRVSVDKAFNLVDHISPQVRMHLLMDLRVRKYHALADKITEDNIMEVASDDLIVLMMMEYMRPKSPQEYEEAMYEAVPHFPKVSPAPFGVTDFDKHFAPLVMKIVSTVLTVDKYMRHGLREEDKKNLPVPGWGDKDERGAVQIAMECLDPWTKNFEAMIKAKRGGKMLRHASCLKTFEDLVLEVTDDYTRLAVTTRQAQLRTNPSEKPEAVKARLEEKRLQKGFINGQNEKRKAAAAANLGRIDAQSWLEQQEYDWQQSQYMAHQYGPQFYGVDWQNPAREDRGPQPVRNFQGAPRGSYGGARDAGSGRGRGPPMRGGNGRGMMSSRGTPGRDVRRPSPAAAVPPPKGFSVEPLVCFKFAIHNECEKGDACDYSHDKKLAEEYIAKMIARYMSSKNYNPSVKVVGSQPQLRQLVADFEIEEEAWYEFQRWYRGQEGDDEEGEYDACGGGELQDDAEDLVAEHEARSRS